MKKYNRILLNLLRFLCFVFIGWFFVYFFLGDQFSIRFVDREIAARLPQILVFLTAVSLYGLFILAIKSTRKKWQNIVLFMGGVLIASIPFLIYHGFFQYRCGIWNQSVTENKILYLNNRNTNESVHIIKSVCEADEIEKTDTIFTQKVLKYFELADEVKIRKGENTSWELVK